MRIITRRSMNSDIEGLGCGPVGIYGVDAEITVEDEGKIIYLHTQWTSEVPEEVLFEATEESVFDLLVQAKYAYAEERDFNEYFDVIDRIREEKNISKNKGIDISIRYAKQYQILLEMMQKILDTDGEDFDLKTMRYADEE